MSDLYARLTRHCVTVNQLNRVHIALENWLTPIALEAIARSAASGGEVWRDRWSGERQAWVANLGQLCRRGGVGHPQGFRKQCLARGLALYTSREKIPGDKRLLVCFTGLAGRMMIPLPVFLQHVDATCTDVIVVRYPKPDGYRCGMPGIAEGFVALLRALLTFVPPVAYVAKATIGVSGGGIPAVALAMMAQFDAALAFGVGNPDDERWRTVLPDGLAGMLDRHGQGKTPATRITLAHGKDAKTDVIAATVVAAQVSARIVAIAHQASPVGHACVHPLVAAGQLRSFLDRALWHPAPPARDRAGMRLDEVAFAVLKPIPEPVGNEVTVFAILKDELYFIPHFLAHYRRLGVRRFLFLDDRSTDGSLEFLLAQPDCGVLQANCDYKQLVQGKRFGTRAKHLVPARFLSERWVLTADLDEFLLLPPGHDGLNAFCQALEAEGAMHSRGLMLDFFPARLDDIHQASREHDPFALCPYFDAFSLVNWPEGHAAPEKISGNEGVRLRMVRQLRTLNAGELAWLRDYKAANLNKVPLVRWRKGVQALSSHRLNFPVSSRHQLIFAHFKFFPGWERKVQRAVASGAYANNSSEYRLLHEAIEKLSAWKLPGPSSHRYQSVDQLARLGLLF